jgi:hypothetical protein
MNEPKPIAPASPRRPTPLISAQTGWRVFKVGIAAQLLIAGVFVVLAAVDGPDPNDGGWADLAFFGGPFLAAGAAFLTAILLAVLAGSQGRARPPAADSGRAFVLGFIGGPLVYLALLMACASLLDDARSVPLYAFFISVVPILCGIGFTLLGYPAWRLRPTKTPPPPG